MKKLFLVLLVVLVLGLSQSTMAYLQPEANLSAMIRRSGHFNVVNPTLRSGEVFVQLPYQLNATMQWQRGHYRGGWYSGYLEKGEWVYAWVVEDCSTYTTYKLSRGRCGNPAKPVCFQKQKYCPPKPKPTPQVQCPPPVVNCNPQITCNPKINIRMPDQLTVGERVGYQFKTGGMLESVEDVAGVILLPQQECHVTVEESQVNTCPPGGNPSPGPGPNDPNVP